MIIQKDDQYAVKYGTNYTEKIEYLHKVITEEETGEEMFKVLNFEAGLGKSFYTDLITKEYINDNNERKFLIVKKFNEESMNSEKNIDVKEKVAVITSDTWGRYWRNKIPILINKQVIIISHKRYIDLCTNEAERAVFAQGRHTLIIDEKINFPIYTYSDRSYSEVRQWVRPKEREVLDEIHNILLEIIEEHKGKLECFKVYPSIKDELLTQFKQSIDDILKQAENIHIRSVLQEFYKATTLAFSKDNLSIINADKIVSRDPLHNHWGLHNNIILDASASLDGVYKASKKFEIVNQQRIIDHKESEYIHIKANSSKSTINRNREFYFKQIVNEIKKEHMPNEKTLLVVHKAFSGDIYNVLSESFDKGHIWLDKRDKQIDEDYNNQQVAISWFGNLIGKNTYSNFNNIWVIGTPNLPLSNYLIHYMQYKNGTLGRRELKVVKGRFKNKELRAVQEGYIAAELYQSLKRIQRNIEPEGRFFIVNHDEKLVLKVIKQMKNAKLTSSRYINVKSENKQYIKKVSKSQQQAIDLHKYISTLPTKSKIMKDELSKQFDIKRWNRVLEQEPILTMMAEGKLKQQSRYFIVS